ncbi:hypothetical protein [Shewanella sedimentimangrovi]|uniref:Tetratricopeptide repeat protein n=1 Tax=Shewanella sedimentimangrovi TaxID=2814293 RepID=A0ABX7R4F5_9GAMM|nr:hypothetical protein [Shewanella sedimentimangrovi]QSX37993.1 hypothetical protein JYB85_03900 [Shewanella sedimentimangrovi]
MDILEYYDLKEWWNTALTPAQREQISRDYQPMGYPSEERYLYAKLVGKSYGDTDKCCLLNVLACVAKDDAKGIIRDKTEQAVKEALSQPRRNYIDIHLALDGLIKYHYPLRNDQAHYEKAKELCLLQISISSKLVKKFRYPEKPKELKRLHKLTGMTHPYYDEPQILPSHTGYKQLAIILEKEGDLEGALELSQKALEQGWSDDYEKRITKLTAKLAKRQ